MIKTIIQLSLVLPFFVFPASAQITDACRADLKHLKLPEHAITDEVLGLEQPPVVFAFAQDGVDVYSATDFTAMQVLKKLGQPLANAFTVILVYQDDRVRQRKIESLRKEVRTLDWFTRGYPYAPLENLKFATWRFELTPVWVDDVLTRQWLVAGMAYFEPVSCEAADERMPASSRGYLEATMNGHNFIFGQMPPVAIPVDKQMPPIGNSVLGKALEVMRLLLKKYGLPN
ncbi:MAG: hypothetical protein ACYDA9_08810 [Terriglobia bacterium]